jgi:hypothetical protein
VANVEYYISASYIGDGLGNSSYILYKNNCNDPSNLITSVTKSELELGFRIEVEESVEKLYLIPGLDDPLARDCILGCNNTWAELILSNFVPSPTPTKTPTPTPSTTPIGPTPTPTSTVTPSPTPVDVLSGEVGRASTSSDAAALNWYCDICRETIYWRSSVYTTAPQVIFYQHSPIYSNSSLTTLAPAGWYYAGGGISGTSYVKYWTGFGWAGQAATYITGCSGSPQCP